MSERDELAALTAPQLHYCYPGGAGWTSPTNEQRGAQDAWLTENRPALDRIGEWAELRGWTGLECPNDCGNCATCGRLSAWHQIIAMLSNTYIMQYARDQWESDPIEEV